MEERIILHSDANSFFASVEMAIDPGLSGKPVAVCGAVEERHGIVLAKSEKAKKAGIITGMTVGDAKKRCPDLCIVRPHYNTYADYSDGLRKIYADFSDRIEPFGMDECWLDVSSAIKKYEDGALAADMIRARVKKELGITVSVGVSFNKVFAKLGSDLKKPNGTTVITKTGFKNQLFGLPAEALLGVGRSTKSILNKHGIYTIGQLASADKRFLKDLFGKSGETLWAFANGFDFAPVITEKEAPPVKSVGHGTTPPHDLTTNEEVKRLITALSQDIGEKLRRHRLRCLGVSLSLRDKRLKITNHQCKLNMATDNSGVIADTAYRMFLEKGGINEPLRSLTVTAINLEDSTLPQQTDLFTDQRRLEKKKALDKTIDGIRRRFGKNAILPALICKTDMSFSQSGLSLPMAKSRVDGS
ncbi:MAG: DNA polymerase IV [Clostridia bacterium]|nr:DNA polymerase IV [Clostridia bacterium]